MANVKCPVCGKIFNNKKVKNIHVGNRYYHFSCCNEDIIYRDKIFQLLKEVWGSYTYVKINNQINAYCKSLNITPKQIYETLDYFFNVLKKNSSLYPDTIGIVPYIYEEALKYWKASRQKEENVKRALSECINNEPTIININTNLATPSKRPMFELKEGD